MCVESFFGSETKKVGDDFKNYLKGKYIAWLTKNNNSIVNYVNKEREKLKNKITESNEDKAQYEQELLDLERSEVFRTVLTASANLKQIEAFTKALDELIKMEQMQKKLKELVNF